MNNIMTVHDLCLWYGSHQALTDINIEIPEKSITALIGPSGCGKSTFLKTINRMNDLIPDVKITGEIKYKEQNIFAPNVDVNDLRREVGMVFQKPNPFPMSIYDNIAYGPRTHGVKNKAKLDDIVERSLRGAAIWDEVKDRLKKNALGLSGGQQQRVALARTLAQNPEIILADEPVAALDPVTAKQVMSDFRKINQDMNISILINIHHVELALEYADRIIGIRAGKIVYDGPSENVTQDVLNTIYEGKIPEKTEEA